MPYTVKYPALYDAQWLTDHYVTQRKSCGDIAEELGCSRALVENGLRRAGIARRGRYPEKWKPKPCLVCGKIFTPVGPAGQFCSYECRHGTKPCEWCESDFVPKATTKAARDSQRFCSRKCRHAHMNENGRSVNAFGYVTIPRKPTMAVTPNGDGYMRVHLGPKRGRILEHRHVMEKAIGRELFPDETVHHRNGVTTDNRAENLELWVSNHPSGQRTEDIVEWAVEMLTRYRPELLAD